jgi:hypothetical protein
MIQIHFGMIQIHFGMIQIHSGMIQFCPGMIQFCLEMIQFCLEMIQFCPGNSHGRAGEIRAQGRDYASKRTERYMPAARVENRLTAWYSPILFLA